MTKGTVRSIVFNLIETPSGRGRPSAPQSRGHMSSPSRKTRKEWSRPTILRTSIQHRLVILRRCDLLLLRAAGYKADDPH